MEILLTIRDIAGELGTTRQAIRDRYKRGTLPDPDFKMTRNWPLWRRATLEKHDILPKTKR